MIRKPLLTALYLVLALQLAGCSWLSIPLPPNIEVPPASPSAAPVVTAAPAFRCTNTLTGGATPRIPTLTVSQLVKCRPEVQTTINTIKRNGPFKYDQDNIVFANREGLLPSKPSGTYHEYTVITPGASTRATRRLITAGSPGRHPADYTSMYYTDDHYQSFWQIQGN